MFICVSNEEPQKQTQMNIYYTRLVGAKRKLEPKHYGRDKDASKKMHRTKSPSKLSRNQTDQKRSTEQNRAEARGETDP